MKILKPIFLSFLFVFASPAFLSAQARSPRDVVDRYIDLHAQGASLTGEAYEAFSDVIHLPEFEPGWDIAFLVEAPQIQMGERTEDGEIPVKVSWPLIAEVSAARIQCLGNSIQQELLLEESDEGWKIQERVIGPGKVSIEALIRHFEDPLGSENAWDEKMLQALRKMKETGVCLSVDYSPPPESK